MKIISVVIVSLIASTFFLDTAGAVSKRSNHKNSGNVSSKVNSQKGVTSVKSHLRTKPNKSKLDNWSTIGNTNPYTGKKGTKRP